MKMTQGNRRQDFRDAVILAGYACLISAVRRKRLRRTKRFITRVLCFHKVESESGFLRKLHLLKKEYNLIALRDMFDEEKLSAKETNIAMTFDDGFPDQLEMVIPRLRELNIPATFFIPSGCIGLTNEEASRFYEGQVGISCDRAVTAKNVGDLAQEGLFEIGAHGRNHLNLGQLPDEDKLWEEIAGAKRDLEEMTGVPVQSFAYPYGDIVNCSEKAVEVLKKSGFTTAFTIVPGFNCLDADRYRLHRDSVDPSMSDVLFRAWLDGAYDVAKAWWNKRKISRHK